MTHEMRHPDSPTWCVYCGTFDIYCNGRECTADRSRRYDSTVPANAVRMWTDMFGQTIADVQP